MKSSGDKRFFLRNTRTLLWCSCPLYVLCFTLFCVQKVCFGKEDASRVALYIRAKGEIKCQQSKGVCTATQNVYIKKEPLHLMADEVRLKFRPRETAILVPSRQPKSVKGTLSLKEEAAAAGRLQKLEALGSVAFREGEVTGQADVMRFDANASLLTLQGKSVLKAQDITLHSDEPITLHTVKKKGRTRNPRIVFQGQKIVLVGETLNYALGNQPQEVLQLRLSTSLQTFSLKGGILLASPTYTVTSDEAFYDRGRACIKLFGSVQIARGSHMVEAEVAFYDLKKQHLILAPSYAEGGERGAKKMAKNHASKAVSSALRKKISQPVKGVLYLKRPRYLQVRTSKS